MNELEVVSKQVTWCDCVSCGGCTYPGECHLDNDDGIGWCCPCCDRCLKEQGVSIKRDPIKTSKYVKSPSKRYNGLKPGWVKLK